MKHNATDRKLMVIDNCHPQSKLLAQWLNEDFPSLNVSFPDGRPDNLMKQVVSFRPDILLVDVEIPLFSSVDILNLHSAFDFSILFVADGDEQNKLKLSEFKFAEILYRPYDRINVKLLVDKVLKERELGLNGNSLLMQYLAKRLSGSPLKKITIPVKDSNIFLNTDGIIYFQSDRNYTKIYLKDGRTLSSSNNLGYFEKLLLHNDFLRIHASFLVNSAEIAEFKKPNDELLMSNGHSIRISRSRRKLLNLL